jgi:peptide/nickel transport system permease protein
VSRGRFLADRRALVGTAILLAAVLVALLAPLVAGDPGLRQDVVATRFLPPLSTDLHGAFHLLGTDRLGRDVWGRIAYGARVSLGVGLLAVAVSVMVGVAVGAAAGFWSGWPATVLLGFTDFALALPRVVLLLLLASLWQPSALLVILVLGLTGWMTIARLVHGEVRGWWGGRSWRGGGPGSVRPAGAAPSSAAQRAHPSHRDRGARPGQRHHAGGGTLVPGLGVQPPTPSWGNLIASGRDTLVNAPWVATGPGVALVLVVLGATLVGDALRDRLDPARPT